MRGDGAKRRSGRQRLPAPHRYFVLGVGSGVAVRQPVGQADGFRQAVLVQGGLDRGDGGREVDAVADRDEEGAAAGLTAHDGADDLALVFERRPVTGQRPWLGEAAEQPRLGDADGRPVQEHTQVAGEAEAPGMGEALAVDHDEFGRLVQHRQGRQGYRHLAEGEKAGAVGKADRLGCLGTLQELKGLGIEADGSGEGGLAAPAEVDVDAGDPAGGEAGGRFFHHLVAKRFL
jgi:hypothetical protein